jgi:uncharacterized protein YkwD
MHPVSQLAPIVLIALIGCGTSSLSNTGAGVPPPQQPGTGTPLSGNNTPPTSGAACEFIGPPASPIHLSLYNRLNNYRLENGLNLLQYSRTLERSADDYAFELVLKKFELAHVDPEGDAPSDRALDAGFCHQFVGENLAEGFETTEQVMQAWKDSPGHNANLLGAQYDLVGVGYYFEPNGRRIWVQEFAASRN